MTIGPTISSILRGPDAVQPSQEEVRDKITQITQILIKQEETYHSIDSELTTLQANPPSPQTLRSQFSLYLLQNPDLQSKLRGRLATQRAEIAADTFLASDSSEPETEPEKTAGDGEDAGTRGVEVQQQEEAEVAEMMGEVEEISREFPDEEPKAESDEEHDEQNGEGDRLSTSSTKEIEAVEGTELAHSESEQEPTRNSLTAEPTQPSPPQSISPPRIKVETGVETDKPTQSPSLLLSPSNRRSNSIVVDEENRSGPTSANSSIIILDGESINSENNLQSSISTKKDSSLPATGRPLRNLKKIDSSEKNSDSLGVISTTGELVTSQESVVPATPSPIKTRLSALTEAASADKEKKSLGQENGEGSTEKTAGEGEDETEKKLTTPSKRTVSTSNDNSKPKRASTRSSLASSSSILPDPPSTERAGPKSSAVIKKRLASPSASSEFSSDLGDGEEDEEKDVSDAERRRMKRGKLDAPSSDQPSRHTEEEGGVDENEDEKEKGKGKEKESSKSKARSKREPISSPIRAPLTRLRSDLSLSRPSAKASRPPSDSVSTATDDSTIPPSSTLDKESLKGSSTTPRQTALSLSSSSQQADESSRPRRAVKDRKAKADVARTKRVRELKGEGKRESESEPDETDEDDGGEDHEKEGESEGMEGVQEDQTADEEEGEPKERRSKRGKVVKEEKLETEDGIMKKPLDQEAIDEKEEVKEEIKGMIDEDEAEKDVKGDATDGDEDDDEDDIDDIDDEDDDLEDEDDEEEDDNEGGEDDEGTSALKRSKRKSISSTGSAVSTAGGAGSNKKLTKAEQAELTAEQAMEAHEQKKAERRVRDRARRERERAAKMTKQAEQAATRERKRKRDLPATQADSTSNDGEHIVKRRRGDFSATPEDSIPNPSAQQPSTRQSSQTPTLTSTSVPTAMSNPRSFKKTIDLLYQQIAQHRSSSIFQSPIRSVDVPDYHEIVYRPMDLKTIKNRVRDGMIMSLDEFERDVFLMFANATLFNEPGSDVYEQAQAMIADSEEQIRQFRLLQQRLAQQDN